jgi:PDDEXK-like uncharacterized protein DUF3799
MNKSITEHGIFLMCKSPLDYWFKYLNPNREPYKESDAAAFDKALRMAVFNRTAFDVLYGRINKDFNLKKPTERAEKQNIIEAMTSKGQIYISNSDYDTVLKMATAIKNHQLANILTSGGESAVKSTVAFEGVEISTESHYSKENVVINITSTSDASEGQFIKDCGSRGWHRKSAMHIDATGKPVMIFIVVEKKEPFNIGIYSLDEKAIDVGRESYRQAAKAFKECSDSNVWYGSSPKITTVNLPEWMLK